MGLFAGWLVLTLAAASSAQMPEPSGLQAAVALENVVVEAIAKAEKSVVAIARIRKDRQEPLEPLEGEILPERDLRAADATRSDFVPHEFGTGVVIDAKGLILTSYHILGDVKASDYVVWIAKTPYRASLRAADPWLDVAVLKIDASDLKPITLGNSRELKKGQIVISLGNPYAIARDGEPSATWGIISNLSRQAPLPRDAVRPAEGRETLHHYGTLIQTDAKLELGTSGGALVNLQGEMIGLTTSLAALIGYEKAGGFAIPVDDDFRRALETLKQGRMPDYGFLGVAPSVLGMEERQQGHRGARILDVVPATPAAKAGILPLDVVTEVDGRPVTDDAQLIRHLSAMPAGTIVGLKLLRGGTLAKPGKVMTVQVELSKKRLEGVRAPYAEITDTPWRGMKVEYATAAPMFRDQSRDLDPEGCVAVIEVERESPAWQAGLRPGDFLSHVGKTRVTTPKQFLDAATAQPGEVPLRLTAVPANKSLRTVAAPADSTP